MAKYTVTVPIKLEADVEADNAEDAAKAISQIVRFHRFWAGLTLYGVQIIGWRPTVDRSPFANAITADKHCITLNEMEIYAELDAADNEITAAATA
jgi:hypothetical protein